VTAKKRAICLLSGGLDSATTLSIALKERYEVFALTVIYGQKHEREMTSARRLAARLGVAHELIHFSLPWGGSALIDAHIPIPQNRSLDQISKDIPVTYVPARNTIFLSFAASFAEAKKAEAIFIGANAIDYSGYPDCRPDYFKVLEEALKKGTKQGTEGRAIRIKTPLLHLNKSEIIFLAQSLQVPLEWTWSCYTGETVPCGTCDSCLLREKGFREAGLEDPLTTVVLK
jgi:7-cyano-7-deazaguanine synthase